MKSVTVKNFKGESREFRGRDDYEISQQIFQWLEIPEMAFTENFKLVRPWRGKIREVVLKDKMTLRVKYEETTKNLQVKEVMTFSDLKGRVAELFKLPVDQLRLYDHVWPLPDDATLVQSLPGIRDLLITAKVDQRVTLHIQFDEKASDLPFWLSDTWKTVRQGIATTKNWQYENVLLARNDQEIDRNSTQTLKDAGVQDNDTVIAVYRPSVTCEFSIEQENGELLDGSHSVTLKAWDTVKRAREALIDQLKRENVIDQDSPAELTMVCGGSILEDEMVLEDLLGDGNTLRIAVNIERDSCVLLRSVS